MKMLDDARDLLAELVNDRRAKRQAAAKKLRPEIARMLADLERENSAKLPILTREFEAADARLARARAELEAAQVERDSAFYALIGWSGEYQRRRTIIETGSRETADPAIAAARAALEAKIETTRSLSAASTVAVKDRLFGSTTIHTNAPSIRQRLAALFAMREQLAALELDFEADVPTRLTELWAAIPAAGEMEAIASRRPETVS
jgi:hypothetical protein